MDCQPSGMQKTPVDRRKHGNFCRLLRGRSERALPAIERPRTAVDWVFQAGPGLLRRTAATFLRRSLHNHHAGNLRECRNAGKRQHHLSFKALPDGSR